MSNRALRRQQMRQQSAKNQALTREYQQSIRQLSAAETIKGLIQQGVTPKALEEQYELGREAGFKQASLPVIRACYAGVCLALHDTFGFGKDRCARVLREMDSRISLMLEDQELRDEVMDKIGLDINFTGVL